MGTARLGGQALSCKFQRRNRILLASVLAVPAVSLSAQSAMAQNNPLYWDANGSGTAGAGTAPAGTWGVDSFWNDDSTGGAAGYYGAWVPGYGAVFAAGTDATGSYGVTVSGTQSVAGIAVEEGTVSFTGGEIDLATPSVNVAGGLTTNIGSVLGGSGPLSVDGSGTLVLSGTNTYLGATTLNAGTLSINADANLGTAPTSPTSGAITLNDSTTLQFTGGMTLNANRGIFLGGSSTTIQVTTGTVVYAGSIESDQTTINKTGTGTLSLTGSTLLNEDADGENINVNQGVLAVSGSSVFGPFPSLVNVNVVSGAAMQISGTSTGLSAALTISGGGIASDGALRKTDSSTTTYGGSITLVDDARINSDAGTFVQVGGGGIGLSGHTLTVGGAGNTTLAGGVSGGVLVKDGTGTLTFPTNASTLTGLVVNNGTVIYGAHVGSGVGGPFAVPGSFVPDFITLNNGAILESSETSIGNGGTTLEPNTGITLGAGSATWIIENAVATNVQIYRGVVTGPGGLIKDGPGRLGLANNPETYQGPTTIVAGTISIRHDGNGGGPVGGGTGTGTLPSTTALTINAGATFDIGLGYNQTVGSIAGGGFIGEASGNAGLLTFGGDNTSTAFSGSVGVIFSGTGSISLAMTKVGTGVTTISTNWANTGTTTINGGAIKYGVSAAGLGDTSPLVIGASGTLDMNGINDTVGSLSGSGNVINAGKLTVGGATDTTWSGVITGGASGALTKSGSGYLVVKAVQAYGGATAIVGGGTTGGIKVGIANALPTGTQIQLNAINSTGVAILDLNGFNQTIGSIVDNNPGVGTPTITNSSATAATLMVNNSTSNTVDFPIAGKLNLIKGGAGALILTGPNSYTGTTTINSGGTIQVGNNNAAGVLPNTTVTDNGTLTYKRTDAVTLSGMLSGTGTLTQAGSGSLTLSIPISIGAVNANAGGIVLPTAAGTSTIGTLAFAGGKLDVTNNKLVLTSTTSTNLVADLLAGRSGGTWTGNGLVSSTAAAASPANTAIGWATAGSIGVTSWGGVNGIASGSLVTKYTYYGDLNLDGKVNADDYALIDAQLALHGLGAAGSWLAGDVNYDSVVNAADYLLMDTAFGNQGGVLSPDFLAERQAEFGSDYVSQLVAAVPEPTSLSVLGIGAIGLLGRRRRNR